MQKLFWLLTIYSIFYTKLPHFDLISALLNNIIDLTIREGNKECIDLFGNIAIWCHKPKYLYFFTKKPLKDSTTFYWMFLFSSRNFNCYFMIDEWWRIISKVIQRNLPQGTRTKVGVFRIFLDLYTTISNGKISDKLYNKYDDF